MKKKKLQLELEQLVEKSGYSIRKERGTFNGSHCIMEGDQLVVINTKKPPEKQIGILFRVLQKTGVEDVYIKPAVRRELDELRERFQKFEDQEPETNINLQQ